MIPRSYEEFDYPQYEAIDGAVVLHSGQRMHEARSGEKYYIEEEIGSEQLMMLDLAFRVAAFRPVPLIDGSKALPLTQDGVDLVRLTERGFTFHLAEHIRSAYRGHWVEYLWPPADVMKELMDAHR